MTMRAKHSSPSRRKQRGITTLAVTLILLVIITMMVIFSANVGFFEQKTTTNQNRARISQQAAEYALNLGGEYLKANRERLISNDAAKNGWLATGATRRWAKCADVPTPPAGHACLSERDLVRRAQMYFWTENGATTGSQSIPYTSIVPAAAQGGSMGGTAAFATTATVGALLCRLDSSLPVPACSLAPVAGNRVAITLVADAALTNEAGARASVRETWASYSTFVPSAAVPLIVSGMVTGLGNGQIVANSAAATPTGTGSNIASMWSPNTIDNGGSYITCQIAEFTGQLLGITMTMAQVRTDCPSATGSSPPCNCPKSPPESLTSKEDWSGHGTGGAGTFHKGHDILDVAAGSEPICDSTVNTITTNCRTLPSITFFPGLNSSGTRMDNATDTTDDSPFEYIFGVDYVVDFYKQPSGAAGTNPTGRTMTNCGTSGTQNCFDYAMREQFDAEIKTCAELNASSSGIIYVPAGCGSISQQIGSPDSPAIVVIDNSANPGLQLKNGTLVYGMVFVHSDTQSADVTGTNPQFYGSLVVEGTIKMTGQFLIVYDDVSASSNPNKLPKSAKFGRVPGSWLDAKTSF